MDEKVEYLPTPDILYKYYSFNKHTESIFAHNNIYFSAPKKFNDPFDSNVLLNFDGTDEQWAVYLQRAFEKKSPNEAPAIIRERIKEIILSQKHKTIPENIGGLFRDKIGIYCMAEVPNSLLMWSHYADYHTGFCMGFDTSNAMFGKAQPIIYSKSYPIVNFFTATQAEKTDAQLLTKANPHFSPRVKWRCFLLPA